MKSIVMYVCNKSCPWESSSKLFHLSGHIIQDLFILTGTNYVACKNIRFSSLFAAGDVSREGTSATLSGIWSEALIGRRSSNIVSAIVYK